MSVAEVKRDDAAKRKMVRTMPERRDIRRECGGGHAAHAAADKFHIPVMLDEVVQDMRPQDGGVYVDATFGAGGYSRALLEAADCTVVAIDRDPSVCTTAQKFKDEYGGRFMFFSRTFSEIHEVFWEASVCLSKGPLSGQAISSKEKVLQGSPNRGSEERLRRMERGLCDDPCEGENRIRPDGIVFDVGVSSMQIDQGHRGFSFQKSGPLDMRMNPQQGETASELLERISEKDLVWILREYGEERHAARVARAICAHRISRPFKRTNELAEVIRSAIPGRPRPGQDKATRSFQALRIAVNDELNQLRLALASSVDLLAEGGRIVVVSFHSLEDRIVKSFLRDNARAKEPVSRHVPDPSEGKRFLDGKETEGGGVSKLCKLRLIRTKALFPQEKEVADNPRARSARLRSAVRINASGKDER